MSGDPEIGNLPNDDRHCIVPGCPRSPGRSGACRSHRNNSYQPKSTRRRGGQGRALTPEQALEARRMLSAFKSRREIAEHFGISYTTLRKYLNEAKGGAA